MNFEDRFWRLNDDHSVTNIPYQEWCQTHDPDKNVIEWTGNEARCVSTIFLGLDHNWGFENPAPVLFESMVFGGEFHELTCRYHTYDEALAGHALLVKQVFNYQMEVR